MKEQFVPYEIALILKDKGFDELCLGYYREDAQKKDGSLYEYITPYEYDEVKECEHMIPVFAPLWQQVIDWLREKHSLDIMTRQLQLDGRSYYKISKIEAEDEIKGYANFCKSAYEAREKSIVHALTLI
jgi:hypothetical protein